MVFEMDEAGLLNSMSTEELLETCKRLQRSCEDMTTLLNEFEQEQEMLLREQDRMHARIEKVASQVEASKRSEDRGIIWNLLNEVDTKLEVSNIFRASAQRQAERRRTRPIARQAEVVVDDDDNDTGPFSDVNVQKSWGCDVALGALRQVAIKSSDVVDLERWIRETLVPESVAEADTVDMWMQKAQMMTDMQPMPSWPTQFQQEDTEPMRSNTGLSGAPLEAVEEGENPDSALSDEEVPREFEPAGRVQSRGPGETNTPRRSSLATLQKGLSWVADVATNLAMPADAEEDDDIEIISLTVVLKRASTDQVWGLGWLKDQFQANKVRIVRQCVKDTIADVWNCRQEEDGHPENAIQPGDHLVSANGKTSVTEMTAELGGREVVLEFQRAIRVASPTAPASQSDATDPAAAQSATPAAGSAPAAPKRPARPKASFSKAFSAYLEGQGVAPSPSGAAVGSTAVPSVEAQGTQGEAAREARDEPPGSSENQAADARNLGAAGESEDASGKPALSASGEDGAVVQVDGGGVDGDEEARTPARPPRDAPYSVVVQVLSITAGSVRLSWTFDWAAAPTDFLGQEGAARSFEVLRSRDAETEEDGVQDSAQVPERWTCSKPMLKVDLPIGRRYSLQVRALITDSSSDAASEPLWVSQLSAAAMADLRSPVRALAERRGEASPGGAKAEAAVGATPPASKRATVASRLGSFLAQPPAVRTPSASSVASAMPPVLAAAPEPAVPESSPSPAAAAGPPGAASAAAENPLATSAPRVISAAPQSAAAEKREIAERLRIRRGGPLVALDPTMTVNRTSSVDSDDGSLSQLASALQLLQRTASGRLGDQDDQEVPGERRKPADAAGESVAEEGHHGLSDRMDSASPLRPSVPPQAKDAPHDAVGASGGEALIQPPHTESEPGSVAGAPQQSTFRLVVRLDDGKAENIDFARGDDLAPIMQEFVTRNRLRVLFVDALQERAELMVSSNTDEATVDIIDLL